MRRLRLTAALWAGVLLVAARTPARVPRAGDGVLTDSVLTLESCFALAHRHNAELRRTAAAVVATYGEKIQSRGRFLPRVNLYYQRGQERVDTTGTVETARDEGMTIEVRQRVAEFGRTTAAEAARQDRERAALYAKENTIVSVLSGIRRAFYSLLVIDRQLAAHDTLLAQYAARMQQADDRLTKGVGLRTALLTARLNWLDERERILQLQAQRKATRATLKEAIGIRVLDESVRLMEPESPAMPAEDSCVVLALDNSTEISDRKAELLQAGRDLGQTGWDFLLDDITFSAGMYKDGKGAALEVVTSDAGTRRWAIDAVGTKALTEPDGSLFSPTDTSLRFTATLNLALPLFRGARRHGAAIEYGARYVEARARMVEKTAEVERATRSAFYEYQMSAAHLEIQAERVAIARERYALAETQHELGRMSDEGLDAFRERLFYAQDAHFGQQFTVLAREEDLRALIRLLE